MKIGRLVLSVSILLINLAIFLISAYVENEILGRTLIFTVACFCLFLSIFNKYINRISIWESFKTFITLHIYAFSNCIIYFIIIGNVTNEILTWILLLLFYVLSSTIILYNFFRIKIVPKFFLDIGILLSGFFAVIYSLTSIQTHYYGFTLMCFLWSLTFSIIIFRNSIKPSHNRR